MAPTNKKEFPYSIRDLTTKDVDQYNQLLRYAFQVTEQELMEYGWESEEIKQSKFPIIERADILGCYDEDKLVSQFAVYPLKMNILNQTYKIGFITSVSTYPEYTGEGIMSCLMKKSLLRMKEKGQSLALLYPYSIPLYRKFGWEIISSKISYRIMDRQIPANRTAKGKVQRVDWENEDFMKLHAQFAKQTHGCLYRNSLAWDEYWRWTEDSTQVAIYYSEENQPLGYLVYLLKEDIMYIKEMIFLNREAQAGLWKYIHAHDSMIDEVRGSTYSNEPMAFDLDDELLDWNNQTFHVTFRDGKCQLTEESADHQVMMTINSLSTLLLGYKTAIQLHRLERINGSVEAINQLDDILYHEAPYISDYI